jgi:hypothetical protein
LRPGSPILKEEVPRSVEGKDVQEVAEMKRQGLSIQASVLVDWSRER